MTLEEKAEEHAKKAFCVAHTHEDELIFKNGYLAGAEPREKRIAELEVINKRISDECHKLVDSLEKAQKENTELKDKFKITKAVDESFALQTVQLTKAKEIIREVMNWYWETDICSDSMPPELRQKAEQFIKE